MALLPVPTHLSSLSSPIVLSSRRSNHSILSFNRNNLDLSNRKFTPLILRAAHSRFNPAALSPSLSSILRFSNSTPWFEPFSPRRDRARHAIPVTRIKALKESKTVSKAKNQRGNSKKIFFFALLSVVIGSCVVFALLEYVGGVPCVGFVRNVYAWVVSKVPLDERTRWIIREKADTVFDWSKGIVGTVALSWVQLIPLIWLHFRHQNAGFADPAKKRQPVIQNVGFDDVEGVGAAKEELLEIVSCLQGWNNYSKLGAEPPRGTLLVGPPGTGKTLLARAVAGEAGVPFFSASASEFVEVFVGRGAARIRDLFKEAKKRQPSIVFIDELDAVGGKRGRSFNDEHDQTLIQLLTEMDGFETSSKVVVIAATNRPETLDPALCRPGRFSRKVLVGKPDLNGRKKILGVHLRDVPLEEDAKELCDTVAVMTPGLVGADLANIVKEGVLLAARRGGDAVSREDIFMAVERAKSGIDKQQGGGTSKDDDFLGGDIAGIPLPQAVCGSYS